ncbi:MAG: hypothetical protein FJ009_01100 [Chloroflexi bacterium]|nr:hypothetical protein [Chloroflexota bacterium]
MLIQKKITLPSNPTAPTFANLRLAIAFIAARIDRGEEDALCDACARQYAEERVSPNLPTHREYRLTAIRALDANHKRTALPRLCADEIFPPDATQYTLGGHAPGWNHVNIDFVKLADGWAIDEIWICR